MKQYLKISIIIFAACLITGCGIKGELYLPDDTKEESSKHHDQ